MSHNQKRLRPLDCISKAVQSVAVFLLTGCSIEAQLLSLGQQLSNNKISVEMTSVQSAASNTTAIPVTLLLSEETVDLAPSQIQVVNGTITNFTGSGKSYSFEVVPHGDGLVQVIWPETVLQTETIPKNTDSAALSFQVDTIRPTLSLATTAPAVTDVALIPITVTFSEAVSGLLIGDFSITGGGASIVSFTGSGAQYTIQVLATMVGPITVGLPQGIAQDTAGNLSFASNVISLTYDNTVPIPLLTSAAATQNNLSTIPVTVDFSGNSVTNLIASDFVLTNATISGFTGSGANYGFNLIPSADGAVSVSLPAGVAENSSAITNLASNTLSFNVDRVAPTLAVTGPSPSIGRSSASFAWTLTYSGADTYSLTAANITLVTTGGVSCSKAVSGTGNVRTVTASACSGTGTVSISVAANTAQDTTGNQTLANTSSSAATVDNTGPAAPTVTLGATPSGLTQSPTITYSAVSDVGGSTVASYRVRILRASDSSVVYAWTAHTSGDDVGSLSLDFDETYSVTVRAVDALGNNGSISSAVTWTTADGIDCGLGSPAPGEKCLGGALFLGSLTSGSTTSAGTDKYMTTPGGCEDVPNDGNRLGSDVGTYYTTADFTPTCSGTDFVVKRWTQSSGYSIPTLTSFGESSGTGQGATYTDDKYGNENVFEMLSPTTTAKAGMSAAASYCSRMNFGGYDDWYLPNRYELNLIYTNKDELPGLSDTYGELYWSSTQGTGSYAWGQQFYDGAQIQEFATQKRNPFRVRCVRRIGPAEPSSLTLGAVSASLTETPTISFGAPSVLEPATTVSRYEVKVVRQRDNTVIQNWTTHTSGQKITGLNLDGGFYYRILVRAIDSANNRGHETLINFLTEADCVNGPVISGAICPTGTIFLGTLSPGSTSGSGTDKYMITPGGCADVPNDGNRGGAGDSSYYTNVDFTPTCSGTDGVSKAWNAGDSSWFDIPTLTNFTSLGSGDNKYGNQNAAEIISFSAAARYCDKMVYGGFNDWYLPNWRELYLIYENSVVIPGLTYGGHYWSSTEHGTGNAWRVDMNGDIENRGKNYSSYVRCVRRY